MKNKYTQVILLVFLLFTVSGCGQTWWETLFERKNVLVITGRHTISGETLELKPGTIVRFKPVTAFSLAGTVVVESGELVFENGGRLIARGTLGNPIIFTREEDEGILTFKENSDGVNTVIEYCKFEKNTHINCENSITIQYSKFDHAWIELGKNSKSLIQYNDFSSLPPAGLASRAITVGMDYIDPYPTIQFNNITGYYHAVTVGSIVKNNNIRDSEQEAILGSSKTIIDSNYIANCNGKTGPDTTGEQVDTLGTYTHPKTEPISGAGCGW